MRRSERGRARASRRWCRVLPCLLVLALLAPPPARAEAPAQTPGQLTSRGRVLASGAIGGSWSGSGFSGTRQSYRVYAAPALTYFLRDRLGLGLTLGGSVSRSRNRLAGTDGRTSDLFIGVLLAFDLPISDQLSVLLQPAFHYVHQWSQSFVSRPEPPPSQPSFPKDLQLQIVRPAFGLQLVLRVSPYLAFAFGPDFWADIIVDDGGLRRIQAMLSDKKQSHVRAQLGLNAGLLLSF